MPVLIGNLRPPKRWSHDDVPFRPSPKTAAEKMAAVEEVLGEYLGAGEEAAHLRYLAEEADRRQAEALARLAGLVGRQMAADMAGANESEVRSALSRSAHKAPTSGHSAEGHSVEGHDGTEGQGIRDELPALAGA